MSPLEFFLVNSGFSCRLQVLVSSIFHACYSANLTVIYCLLLSSIFLSPQFQSFSQSVKGTVTRDLCLPSFDKHAITGPHIISRHSFAHFRNYPLFAYCSNTILLTFSILICLFLFGSYISLPIHFLYNCK